MKKAPTHNIVFLLNICTPLTRKTIVEMNLMQVKTPLASSEEFCDVKPICLNTEGP